MSEAKCVGFHFRCDVEPDWRALVAVFDQRASLLGCPPPGSSLKPRARRAVITGTIDWRLRRGGLRYDVVLRNLDGLVDVEHGRTDDGACVGFGVSALGSWCSDETVWFTSAGLLLPEQLAIDEETNVPATMLASLRFWESLAAIREVQTHPGVPSSTELPTAPGWTFGTAWRQWTLRHPLVRLNVNVTTMEPVGGW